MPLHYFLLLCHGIESWLCWSTVLYCTVPQRAVYCFCASSCSHLSLLLNGRNPPGMCDFWPCAGLRDIGADPPPPPPFDSPRMFGRDIMVRESTTEKEDLVMRDDDPWGVGQL